MKIFEKSITVSKSDLDQLNHVNNVRYVQWVQDIAESHWLKEATQEIRSKYYWVLIKHTLDYKYPAFLEDVILLRTYVSQSEGVTSTRKVEIMNSKSDKLLVKSETKWCLMSKENNRPIRITQEIKDLFN